MIVEYSHKISYTNFVEQLLDLFKKDFFETEVTPGVYELVDMIRTIIQNISLSGFEFELEADTISMQSVLRISNPIHFDSELNKALGFLSTHYSVRTHESEKRFMITSIDKVHLKCDSVDGSIVIGKRE